jgi:hypothetical protein
MLCSPRNFWFAHVRLLTYIDAHMGLCSYWDGLCVAGTKKLGEHLE